ncbi:leucyl aminopeptidase [Desulfonema magnum]|uniref:Probable cytosol aminopeptidase n=1 Tax=Desulfonema magnum TaxID=45655 RepID=A0A975BX50_9BACT|nr:leucyl aminopeptidase [Desulfonema magnum]QTA92800.1 putative cytosol aminopeptidase [Desulfonema magnum]
MLELKSVNLIKDKIETLVIPVCEDKEIHDNQTIVSVVKKAKKIRAFKGEKDQEVIFHDSTQINAERIIFLGLGKFEKTDAEVLRTFAGKSVKKCIAKDPAEVLIAVPSEKKTGQDMAVILEAIISGALLGNHLFDKYKTEKKQKPLKNISLFMTSETAKKFSRLASSVSAVCEGTILAREWVSIPSNDKTPEQLAQVITKAAGKELSVTVLKENELKKKGFGAILAVGAGSANKSCMAVLEYKAKNAKKTVALVGKGITFDSGGINLKPGGSSREMKMDMAGAAAVAATLITVARLKPAMNVIGIVPLVENMLSGTSYRPGDIIKTYHGKTVEVGNTDAEGRLILCDALAYAVKTYKPQTIIDLATLTGACIVALGEKFAGAFSFDDKLAEKIVQSGNNTHERCWRLPLPDDYKESLKSEIADINNISEGDVSGAGAITAALFLSEFVGDTRWAHIDIAGPAYHKKGNKYCGPGGTGFGVRLLCDLLEKL